MRNVRGQVMLLHYSGVQGQICFAHVLTTLTSLLGLVLIHYSGASKMR